jgi:hypothetical protein
VHPASVTWKVDTEDDTPVLSGGVLAGDRTYTATLEATVYQDDLTAGGLVDYSWANKGTQVPFTYTPYAGAGRSPAADRRPPRRRRGREQEEHLRPQVGVRRRARPWSTTSADVAGRGPALSRSTGCAPCAAP